MRTGRRCSRQSRKQERVEFWPHTATPNNSRATCLNKESTAASFALPGRVSPRGTESIADCGSRFPPHARLRRVRPQRKAKIKIEMFRFSALYDAIDRTTSTNAKVAAMVAYFRDAPRADAAWAVFFLTGRRLKRLVPYAAIHQWTLAATGLDPWLLEESYAVVGDGAETAALVLDQVAVVASDAVPLAEWVETRILPLRELDEETQQRRVTSWWSGLD